MTLGLLILRIVMGLTMAAHGSQKLLGWFEGPGQAGTTGTFTKLGFRWPAAMALMAGAAELFGGLLFAAGLVTPFAAIALIVVMLNAIITVHWQKGFFVTAGGYEYNLAIIAIATGVSAMGPGADSVDSALGIAGTLSGEWWAPIVVAVAAAVSIATTTLGREHAMLTGHPAA
ncbi:MAG TPA: DoxX family protein [Gaiellales bacterium]|nr:DoxX family protein [Gaiellales bacterium]